MDDPAQPMTDADITPPPASTSFEAAAPLKDQGVSFDPEGGTLDSDKPAKAADQIRQGAQKLTEQAGDRARQFASQGKERATGALDQLTELLNDAAGQVDSKLGEQYGQYARQAAGTVSQFADQVRAKDVDQLIAEAQELVRKSPGVAIGAAAAVGFVIARLVSSGFDQRQA